MTVATSFSKSSCGINPRRWAISVGASQRHSSSLITVVGVLTQMQVPPRQGRELIWSMVVLAEHIVHEIVRFLRGRRRPPLEGL